jgi:hypothetical protein
MWCGHYQTSTNSNKNCIMRKKTMIMNTCKNSDTNLEPPTCLVVNIGSPTASPLQARLEYLKAHTIISLSLGWPLLVLCVGFGLSLEWPSMVSRVLSLGLRWPLMVSMPLVSDGLSLGCPQSQCPQSWIPSVSMPSVSDLGLHSCAGFGYSLWLFS